MVVVTGGVVVVVGGAVVVGTAHGSTASSAGVSAGTASEGTGAVVVVTGAGDGVGVVEAGWASAADPPTATITTVVPATTHRCHHLLRGTMEPRWVCEFIWYLLSFMRTGVVVAPSLLQNLNLFPRITNAPDNTSVTKTIRLVCF